MTLSSESDPRNSPTSPTRGDVPRIPPRPESTSSQGSTPGPEGPSLEKLLGSAVYLELKDGRTVVGLFTCVDSEINIILRGAEEFPPPPDPDEGEEAKRLRRNKEEYWPRSEPFAGWDSTWGGRSIGMIGVKGQDVRSIRVTDEVWEGMGGTVGRAG